MDLGLFDSYASSPAELRSVVDDVASQMALVSADVIKDIKVGLSSLDARAKAFEQETKTFLRLGRTTEAQDLTKRSMKVSGNQTRNAFELGLDKTFLQLYQSV